MIEGKRLVFPRDFGQVLGVMVDLAALQAAGLLPEQARRAHEALAGGDLRGFVHELLLHGFWSEVIDETPSRPLWVERWRELAAAGFPIIDGAALERLQAAGIDLDDLTTMMPSWNGRNERPAKIALRRVEAALEDIRLKRRRSHVCQVSSRQDHRPRKLRPSPSGQRTTPYLCCRIHRPGSGRAEP